MHLFITKEINQPIQLFLMHSSYGWMVTIHHHIPVFLFLFLMSLKFIRSLGGFYPVFRHGPTRPTRASRSWGNDDRGCRAATIQNILYISKDRGSDCYYYQNMIEILKKAYWALFIASLLYASWLYAMTYPMIQRAYVSVSLMPII